MAVSKAQKFALEEVFRSQNVLLTNLITTEFTFVLEFFDLRSSQCEYIFNAIFSKILNHYIDWVQTTTAQSFDCISILLMVLVNDEFRYIMKERKIEILDYYFDKVGQELWPRFTQIFEHFQTNLETSNPAFNLESCDVHFTTKRYVSLMLMLYKIAYKTGQNMLLSRLTRFQGQMVKFIGKVSEEGLNARFKE